MSTLLLKYDHRNRGEAKSLPCLASAKWGRWPGAAGSEGVKSPLSRLTPTAPPSLTGQGSLEYFFLLAEDEGFDLIKVSPPSRPAASGSPPDCRIFDRSNPTPIAKEKSPTFRLSFFFWQRMRDSNPRERSQSPVCYRYTNPLSTVSDTWLLFSSNMAYYTQLSKNVKYFFQISQKFFRGQKSTVFA